jgi:Fe2+ or Zn2+ uptake regulation protein
MNLMQRHTRQRQVILEELQKVTSHPTAVVLYEIVRQHLPKISLGTVYRNLDLLVQAGLVQKLEACGEEAHYDGNVQPHNHLRCITCGRVDDILSLPLDLLEGAENDFRGYRVLGYRLEFVGICPECQANPSKEHGVAGTPSAHGTLEREN